jgi:hypothetical protein
VSDFRNYDARGLDEENEAWRAHEDWCELRGENPHAVPYKNDALETFKQRLQIVKDLNHKHAEGRLLCTNLK